MREHVLRVKIEGMHCGSCINHLDNVLSREGATDVDIDIARKFGVITFVGESDDADIMIRTIEEAGYTPTKLSVVPKEDA